MPSRLSKRHQLVGQQLTALAAAIATDAEATRQAQAVSAWSVLQHVEHLALAHHLVFARFRDVADTAAGRNGTDTPHAASGTGGSLAAKPGKRRGPTLIGRLVLLTGYIPRGRGRAPKATQPDPLPQPAAVRERLAATSKLHASLELDLPLLADAADCLPHPYFGMLRFPQWLRFVEIHHRHHLAITRDIIAAQHPPR